MKKLRLAISSVAVVLMLVTQAEAAETLAELTAALDYVWILTAAALVFMMQGGFMCLESGLARAKNSINVSIKNMADFVISVAGFWAVGFGLMFGTSQHGLFGTSHFFSNFHAEP